MHRTGGARPSTRIRYLLQTFRWQEAPIHFRVVLWASVGDGTQNTRCEERIVQPPSPASSSKDSLRKRGQERSVNECCKPLPVFRRESRYGSDNAVDNDPLPVLCYVYSR